MLSHCATKEIPVWKSLPCKALQAKKCLRLRYHGYQRIVEVHAVGSSTKDGGAIMRVWQVRGGSESGEYQGWKLLRLEEAIGGEIIDEPSHAPRQGYKRGDSAMSSVTCQL